MINTKKPIPLATPTMHGEELKFVQEAFDRNWIAPLGFNCDGLEKEMNEYLVRNGGKNQEALSLVSCTSALHLAVKLAGVKRGDKVFCSDMTFAATVNPVSYEGGEQVYIDSEYETWNMDPAALEKAFVDEKIERYPALERLSALAELLKVENITDHKMHSEYYEISKESADIINLAKKEGRRVIAVGTTSISPVGCLGFLLSRSRTVPVTEMVVSLFRPLMAAIISSFSMTTWVVP